MDFLRDYGLDLDDIVTGRHPMRFWEFMEYLDGLSTESVWRNVCDADRKAPKEVTGADAQALIARL